MTYRAKQHGAAITEVPISFVDREAGESKMSSFIVVEALALVTWWALGRLVHGVRRLGRKPRPASVLPRRRPGPRRPRRSRGERRQRDRAPQLQRRRGSRPLAMTRTRTVR